MTSTLDGRTVLPHRIAWIGSTTLPAGQVRQVAFLVDGRVRWIEHEAPYTYSDDGGYLVTSWLAPGRHTFAVRVSSTDGRTRTRTVTTRVRPAKRPPAKLAGVWTRVVRGTPEELGGPAGRYTLHFERRWLQDRAPGLWNPTSDTGYGGIVDNDWVPGPRTFEIAGSVTFRVLHDSDAEGGWWCEPGGPKATYGWSVRATA